MRIIYTKISLRRLRQKLLIVIMPLLCMTADDLYSKIVKIQAAEQNPVKLILPPAQEGYFQIADSFYGWFKYELNKHK